MHKSDSKSPKFTISKETTFLTEPLRPDGYVDYLRAMNEHLSRGVTPENNAAIELIQAMGPGCIDEKNRKETLARLGLPNLPEKGAYFISLDDFLKTQHPQQDLKGTNLGEKWESAVGEQEDFAAAHAWSKEEYPLLAAWIEANERPLEILASGCRKNRFYLPIVAEKGKSLNGSDIIACMTETRDILRLLRFRTTYELHDNRVEEAWQEILTGYRLARLYGQKPMMVDRLVGIALEGIADSAVKPLVFSNALTAKQATRFLQDLDQLPPWPRANEVYDYGERLFMLDSFQDMAVNGFDPKPFNFDLPNGENFLDPFESSNRAMKRLANDPRLDWNEAFRYFNYRHNKFVEAWDCPDFAKQQELMHQLQNELSAFHEKDIATVMDDKYLSTATPTTLARHLVEISVSLDTFMGTFQAESRRRVSLDLCRLALALAAYRDAQNVYPSSLSELCPKYLATVPNDPFSGKGLIYKPEDEGYLLFSVGPNGVDDGGQNFNNEHETAEEFLRATKEELDRDDIAIRTPRKKETRP